LCGAALIQVEDAHYEFFEALLTPNRHFIPSGPTADEIDRALSQARRRPELTAEIGRNAHAFATSCLRMVDVLSYMRNVLSVYSSALTYAESMEPESGAYRIVSHADIDALSEI
jgi:hypothetical protein